MWRATAAEKLTEAAITPAALLKILKGRVESEKK